MIIDMDDSRLRTFMGQAASNSAMPLMAALERHPASKKVPVSGHSKMPAGLPAVHSDVPGVPIFRRYPWPGSSELRVPTHSPSPV